jgi:hypothetical protein
MKKVIPLFLHAFLLFGLFSCNLFNKNSDELNAKETDNSSAFDKAVTEGSGNKNESVAGFSRDSSFTIKLTPFIPDYPDLGESGKKLLATRINAATSKVGLAGDGGNPRFIIGPDINLLSKNITSTAPTKYANTYEVTLMSCDVVSQTIFSSYTFQVKGVGDSPDKAFINAFRDYKLENADFLKFLEETEKKILAYYEKNCDNIISEADAQAQMRNYDAAYTILSNIPQEATTCYSKIASKKIDFFQMSLNTQCQTILSSMKAEMGKANDPSASGFNEPAMAYYQMIDPQSSCYKEAESVYKSYTSKLNPKSKRDWDFQMQQYQDKIKKLERDDQFKRDSTMENFSYLKNKDEMQAKAEIEGNKKLLQKYQYDELPWIRKVFHLGKHDPFDRIDK